MGRVYTVGRWALGKVAGRCAMRWMVLLVASRCMFSRMNKASTPTVPALVEVVLAALSQHQPWQVMTSLLQMATSRWQVVKIDRRVFGVMLKV